MQVVDQQEEVVVRKINIRGLLLALSFTLMMCFGEFAFTQTSDWTNVHTDIVDRLNGDIKADTPTADIGIYYPSNLDKAFTSTFSINDLVAEFSKAKDIFAVAGVQLNLLWIKTGDIKPAPSTRITFGC